MSAEPQDLQATSVDVLIGASVRALIAGNGVSYEDVAAHVGLSRAALYNKVSGASEWKVREAMAAASFFGRDLNDLMTGLGGVVRPPSSRTGSGRSRGGVRQYRDVVTGPWNDEAPLRGHRAGLRTSGLELVAPTGVDPVTSRFSVVRSTN